MLESADVRCPYCGEWIELDIDGPAVAQDYIEDCAVCCRPMVVRVTFDEDGIPQVTVRRDDE